MYYFNIVPNIMITSKRMTRFYS